LARYLYRYNFIKADRDYRERLWQKESMSRR
jgi:hypothetical protein